MPLPSSIWYDEYQKDHDTGYSLHLKLIEDGRQNVLSRYKQEIAQELDRFIEETERVWGQRELDYTRIKAQYKQSQRQLVQQYLPKKIHDVETDWKTILFWDEALDARLYKELEVTRKGYDRIISEYQAHHKARIDIITSNFQYAFNLKEVELTHQVSCRMANPLPPDEPEWFLEERSWARSYMDLANAKLNTVQAKSEHENASTSLTEQAEFSTVPKGSGLQSDDDKLLEAKIARVLDAKMTALRISSGDSQTTNEQQS
jgi:hypothetical protein